MEMKQQRSRKGFLIKMMIIGAAVFVIVFLGAQYLTKTGLFRVPGVIYYDESLSANEKTTMEKIFDGVTLEKDVTITGRTVSKLPNLSEGEFLTEVLVPVTDFYETRTDVSEYETDEYEMIPINELNSTKKLLTVNDEYYLDTFETGAEFRIVSFASENYTKEIMPLVTDEMETAFPNDRTVLTFAQTGVTALGRGMNKKLAAVGDATYFAANIGDYLSSFDLTHTSNESSFSTSANEDNICSDPRFISTLTAIGLDIVELTGNHNQDCGDEAAAATIDIYNQNNIKVVGGGKTASAAAVPLELNQKETGITLLAYNLSTGGATLDNTPGANQYSEENAKTEIAAAKERGDFIIVDVQYYECSAYVSESEDNTCDFADSAAGDQIGFFRSLIDMGADMVVGTSAHQPQTFELYGDGVIYYGLGNLFFDQVWWPGTTRSLILAHYFYNGELLQTKVVPTVYDNNMQTELMPATEAKMFLTRLVSERPSK